MTALDWVALASCLVIAAIVAAAVHPATGPTLRRVIGLGGALGLVWGLVLAVGVLARRRKTKTPETPDPGPPVPSVDAIRGRTAQREARIVVAEAEEDRDEVRERLWEAIQRRQKAEEEL